MKTLWQTAFAAYRLSLQTGSDDGYYPGPDYKFAHGSKRERKAINRALDIYQGKDDPLKFKEPCFILVKQANRKRAKANRWGPNTLAQYNCRCAVIELEEALGGALVFGKAGDEPRTMHGLGDPELTKFIGEVAVKHQELHERSLMSDKQREAYEAAMAEHRERHRRLLEFTPGGVNDIAQILRQQIVDMGLDPDTGVIVAHPEIDTQPSLKAREYKFVWVHPGDESTTRPIHKPKEDSE